MSSDYNEKPIIFKSRILSKNLEALRLRKECGDHCPVNCPESTCLNKLVFLGSSLRRYYDDMLFKESSRSVFILRPAYLHFFRKIAHNMKADDSIDSLFLKHTETLRNNNKACAKDEDNHEDCHKDAHCADDCMKLYCPKAIALLCNTLTKYVADLDQDSNGVMFSILDACRVIRIECINIIEEANPDSRPVVTDKASLRQLHTVRC